MPVVSDDKSTRNARDDDARKSPPAPFAQIPRPFLHYPFARHGRRKSTWHRSKSKPGWLYCNVGEYRYYSKAELKTPNLFYLKIYMALIALATQNRRRAFTVALGELLTTAGYPDSGPNWKQLGAALEFWRQVIVVHRQWRKRTKELQPLIERFDGDGRRTRVKLDKEWYLASQKPRNGGSGYFVQVPLRVLSQKLHDVNLTLYLLTAVLDHDHMTTAHKRATLCDKAGIEGGRRGVKLRAAIAGAVASFAAHGGELREERVGRDRLRFMVVAPPVGERDRSREQSPVVKMQRMLKGKKRKVAAPVVEEQREPLPEAYLEVVREALAEQEQRRKEAARARRERRETLQRS